MLVLTFIVVLTPHAAAFTDDDDGEQGPAACFEGYAFPRAQSAVRHYAILCHDGKGKANFDVYQNTMRVDHERIHVTVRVDAATQTMPSVRAETWTIDGRESLRFVATATASPPPTYWTPAAGGGTIAGWNFVAIRHYAEP